MNKLFVLVPFIVVASMSYSADFDGGKEKARVPIRVNKEGLFLNAEGSLAIAGPYHPKISGKYIISIDETATVKDLVNSLYDEPSLFEDTRTGNLVQGLVIEQLAHPVGAPNMVDLRRLGTVLSTIGIRNGELYHELQADLGLLGHSSPLLYTEPARAYYERFPPGEYINTTAAID